MVYSNFLKVLFPFCQVSRTFSEMHSKSGSGTLAAKKGVGGRQLYHEKLAGTSIFPTNLFCNTHAAPRWGWGSGNERQNSLYFPSIFFLFVPNLHDLGHELALDPALRPVGGRLDGGAGGDGGVRADLNEDLGRGRHQRGREVDVSGGVVDVRLGVRVLVPPCASSSPSPSPSSAPPSSSSSASSPSEAWVLPLVAPAPSASPAPLPLLRGLELLRQALQ